jgi:fluoride exporter
MTESRDHRATTGDPFPGSRRSRWPRLQGAVLGAVFAGGILGGLARYGVTSAWPTPARAFPWAIFVVNTVGALALALLLVVLAEVWTPHRFARPLLGTGFLGAFTTFSSVMVDAAKLAAHGHGRTSVLYVAGSLLAALGAASLGLQLGRAIGTNRHHHTGRHPGRQSPRRT